LQVAQARGIGRGNVDGEIVGRWRERFDAEQVIGDPIGRVFVGPDIDADDAVGTAREAAS
jgi:hypothetical protein